MDKDKKVGPGNTGSSQSNTSNSADTKDTDGKQKSFREGLNSEECVAQIKAAFEPNAKPLKTLITESNKKPENQSEAVSDDEDEPVVQGEGMNKKLVSKKPAK